MKRVLFLVIKFSLVFSVLFFIFGIISQLVYESTWFTSSIAYLLNKDNFHEIVPGKVYRSGELSKDNFNDYLIKHQIKAVIDLRMSGDDEAKYGFSEKKSAEEHGASYMWIPLVGTKTNQADSIKKLIALSDQTDGPVLIHCSSGTHRSGVVTAIWLMLKNLDTPIHATEQLSTKYGYFYWERRFKSFIIGHQTIDAIIWNYINQYKQTGIDFKQWFTTHSSSDLSK